MDRIKKNSFSWKNKTRLLILLFVFPLFAGAAGEEQIFSTTFDTTPFQNGWHMLCAEARDAQDNIKETCIPVKIQNTGKKK